MFATNMMPMTPPNLTSATVPVSDPNNFSTIQNLFSTSVPLPTQTPEASLTQPNETLPSPQNFSTMQHLFATNNMNFSPEMLQKVSSNTTPSPE